MEYTKDFENSCAKYDDDNLTTYDSFSKILKTLVENEKHKGFNYENASKALLYYSLSIGVEHFDKDQLTEILRITMNKVMAEKYSEFKMLDAPEMFQ
jgi:hypothetical protein